MLDRLELIVGQDNIEKIKSKNILLIGIGGVGGYVLESLVRCGISNITIVDFDKVDITNLNRQIISSSTNIGEYKVDEAEKRTKSINPDCNIKKVKKFLLEEDIDKLIEDYDYVVDACDTVSVKKEIIRICIKKKIKFISSMGTANKLDPSRLKIMDIRKTNYDPLAKIIRKMVKDEKIKEKVMVVCSDEAPIKNSERKLGSTAFVPAVSGLLCTSYIIRDIVGDLNGNDK